MASRRILKKNVNYITEELFAECLINNMLIPNVDKNKANELMNEILKVRNDFICRISHTEPGSVKLFYKKFQTDFNAKIKELTDAIENLK